MRCRQCNRPNLTSQDFMIFRDGKWLNTAICTQCINNANVAHNAMQRKRKSA